MSETRRGNLLLAQHATIRARLRHRPRARGSILASMQMDEATWVEADRAWSAYLDGAAGRGQLAEVAAWQSVFAAARAELEAEGDAPQAPAVTPPPAPPSSPQSPQAAALRASSAAVPTYLQGHREPALGPPLAFVPPAPESPRPRSRPHPTTTIVASLPASPTPLPFARSDVPNAPASSSSAVAPRVPTGTMPLETPDPAAGSDRLEGFSLDEYAKLEAELALFPAHRAEVLVRHRLAGEDHYRHIATTWKRCIAEQGLSSTYIGLYARHRQARSRG